MNTDTSSDTSDTSNSSFKSEDIDFTKLDEIKTEMKRYIKHLKLQIEGLSEIGDTLGYLSRRIDNLVKIGLDL